MTRTVFTTYDKIVDLILFFASDKKLVFYRIHINRIQSVNRFKRHLNSNYETVNGRFYTLPQIKKYLKDTDIKYLQEEEIALKEGEFRIDRAVVIRAIAKIT